MLRLREYQNSDARRIVAWLEDERQFARWAAGRMQWPLTEERFQAFAAELLKDSRTMLVTAADELNEPVGFLCMTKADYEKHRIHFCFIDHPTPPTPNPTPTHNKQHTHHPPQNHTNTHEKQNKNNQKTTIIIPSFEHRKVPATAECLFFNSIRF